MQKELYEALEKGLVSRLAFNAMLREFAPIAPLASKHLNEVRKLCNNIRLDLDSPFASEVEVLEEAVRDMHAIANARNKHLQGIPAINMLNEAKNMLNKEIDMLNEAIDILNEAIAKEGGGANEVMSLTLNISEVLMIRKVLTTFKALI